MNEYVILKPTRTAVIDIGRHTNKTNKLIKNTLLFMVVLLLLSLIIKEESMAIKNSGEDLVGKRYGLLTVKEELDRKLGHRVFSLKCDCGKETTAYIGHLKEGLKKDCGCKWKPGLVGKRFERLLVVEQVKVAKRGRHFSCKCDCGKDKIVLGTNLLSGSTVSCGCKRRLPEGQAQFNKLYSRYKREAKNRNLAFELTREEFKIITSNNCFYCNTPPKAKKYPTEISNGFYAWNGIDRVNNHLGYNRMNSVACCDLCNKLKRDLTIEYFISHINRIHNNRSNI